MEYKKRRINSQHSKKSCQSCQAPQGSTPPQKLPHLAQILPHQCVYVPDLVPPDRPPVFLRFLNDMFQAPVADTSHPHLHHLSAIASGEGGSPPVNKQVLWEVLKSEKS